ncbi:hypothetical protein [Nostoc sp.]|uniref:hypothetical protein n=1 Tax=Nostoc sp. TaxID=1180 RepID=UPI002FF9A435
MLNKTLHQLKVNGKNISWERIYGTALGVQKYTTTHVSGDGDGVTSRIEIITEFWLKEGNGRETQIKLSGADVKVREGQRVSLVWAYTKSKTSPYVIFVNHDFQDWCWLCTPTLFLSQMKVVRLLPAVLVGYILPMILVVCYSFKYEYFFLCLLVGIIVSLIILLQVIQLIRIFSAWKSMQPEIANLIKTLI